MSWPQFIIFCGCFVLGFLHARLGRDRERRATIAAYEDETEIEVVGLGSPVIRGSIAMLRAHAELQGDAHPTRIVIRLSVPSERIHHP